MGTSDAIIAHEPSFCSAFEQTVFYVPEGVAALSEPAFCAIQADKIVNEGVLGFHLLYDPASGEADFQRVMSTWKLLLKYNAQGKAFVRLANLKPTKPHIFYLRSSDPKWDRRLVDWEDLKADGFECVASMVDLQKIIKDRASA